MSNWRINFGIGPFRYTKPINGNKPKVDQPKKEPGCLGLIITVVVTLVLIYLCCWGGVALLPDTPTY